MGNKFFIGGDQSAHELKAKLKKFFESEGVEFVDLGVFNGDESAYPDIVREVTEKVNENDGMGILVFGKQ